MKIVDLKTENLVNPLGIASERPRFSWRVETEEHNFLQQAYEIRLYDDDAMIWESGKVFSGSSVNVEGVPRLRSLKRYKWQVRITDDNGKLSEWSEPAFFETGFLNHVWIGKWIAGIHNGKDRQPVNYLRKSFKINKGIVSARLYSSALGLYEASINGKKVTEDCFTPGWTDYYVHVQHQTYDVTKLLQKGDNVIGVMLGEGWYCGSISRRRNGGQPSYGSHPNFIAELHIRYKDGSKSIIETDESWQCSIGGPLRMSDIYDGETYDANYDMAGWDKPEFKSCGWTHCLVKNRRIRIIGISAPPVRRIETLPVKSFRELSPELWEPVPCVPHPVNLIVVDFGQNITGREQITVTIPKGEKVTINHGEVLNPNGTVHLKNLRSAQATTTIIGNGEPVSYEPAFTFYGFRYLQIINWPGKFDPGAIKAEVIHTDMRRTGYFKCSNNLVNKFYSNQLWSQRGNYLDIPTDCPQRDERLGWLGDAQVFVNTAGYNFDVCAFFTKFLTDVNYSRTAYGEYPQYAPFFAISHLDAELYGTDYYKGHSGWADAAIICPWQMYLKYNDKRILERFYENIKQWILFQKENSNNLIRSSVVWEDWLNHAAPTSEELISTAFFAYGTALTAKIAKIIGREYDAVELSGLANNIKKAFCKKFIDTNGRLIEKCQTAALLTLHFDLAPENIRNKIFEDLVNDVLDKRETHLSTGFLGTPYLAHVFTRFGRPDIAYKLIEQTTYPSWLYPVTQGATTIWERWNSYCHDTGILNEPMNSFNHYAYGAVADYFYGNIGGIRPFEAAPGFKHIIIEPVPGGSLTYAETSFDSFYGKIVSNWQLKGEIFEMFICIPPNTTAEIRFPAENPANIIAVDRKSLAIKKAANKTVCTVGSGQYRFKVKLTTP
jgi:alpha-L-rhamnosidase